MKTNVTILLIILSVTLSAQEFITGNIAQDTGLAFLGDDKGNDPFTTNVIIRSEWQGKGKEVGYGFVYPEFEIAELKGGTYRRFTIGYGRTFYLDKLFNAPALENFRGTISAGYGITDYNGGFRGADLTLQLSYKITPWLEGFISLQNAERKDLKQYGDHIRSSGSAGVKVYVFNTQFSK